VQPNSARTNGEELPAGQPKPASRRGGRRVPGPGKKLGRPAKQEIEARLAGQRILSDSRHNRIRREKERLLRQDPEYRLRCLLKTYGLTRHGYEQALAEQRGLCAICGLPPLKRALVIDHDHHTGEFRGLIHYHCNTFLGWLETRGHLLNKALDYLSRHKEKHQSKRAAIAVI
jgi:hypothetical protein